MVDKTQAIDVEPVAQSALPPPKRKHNFPAGTSKNKNAYARLYWANRTPEQVERKRQQAREWARKNPEQLRANEKRYREKNREKIHDQQVLRKEKNRAAYLAYHREYYQQNAVARRAYRRQYREQHAEELQAYDRQYQQTPRGRASARTRAAKRRSAKRAACSLTAEQWADCLDAHNHCCAYCGQPFDLFRKPTQDHVVPLSAGGEHAKDNIVPACKPCNSSKGTRPADDFRKIIKQKG